MNELKGKDLGKYLISIRLRLWFVFLGIAGLILVGCQGVGGLRPLPPDIELNQIISSQPQLVTFTELEADPTIYQDKLIRVTGTYVTLPVVSCSPYSGPNTSWALVADGLRLDMLGFEGLLNQFNVEEMNLTLDGILRRYDGPLGCGKRPDPGVLWYLEAQQIVQPNPLVQADTGPSGDPSIVPPPFPTGTSLPPGEEEPTTGPGTPTRTPTPTGTTIATASSTPTIETEETASPESTTTVTRTPTRTTTPTPTQTTTAGGTSTPSPTPSQTPTPGAGSTPLPTTTPGGGYPGDPTPYP